MNGGTAQEGFVWVIVEKEGGQEHFLGLDLPQGGPFIPVTGSREDGLMLVGRLPQSGATREVESIHRRRLLTEAKSQGFVVYLVDGQGRLLKPLDAPN